MNISEDRLVVKMEGGSALYGLSTNNSDTDIWGIHVPRAEDALLDNVKGIHSFSTGEEHKRNSAGDIDYMFFTFVAFVRQGYGGDTKVLDMLFASDDQLIRGPHFWIFEEIVKDRLKFFSKDNGPHLRYVMHQASKYGIKGSRYATLVKVLDALKPYSHDTDVRLRDIWGVLPFDVEHVSTLNRVVNDKDVKFYRVLGKDYQESIKVVELVGLLEKVESGYSKRVKQAHDNENVDWKALSHALRMSYQLQRIYKEGGFEYPLPESKRILDVKLGKVDFREVSSELEDVVDSVTSLAVNSDFPDKVDTEFWETKLREIAKEVLKAP